MPELLSNALYHVFTRDDASAAKIRESVYGVWRNSRAERERTMRLLMGAESRRSAFSAAFARMAFSAVGSTVSELAAGKKLKQLVPALASYREWARWPVASLAPSRGRKAYRVNSTSERPLPGLALPGFRTATGAPTGTGLTVQPEKRASGIPESHGEQPAVQSALSRAGEALLVELRRLHERLGRDPDWALIRSASRIVSVIDGAELGAGMAARMHLAKRPMARVGVARLIGAYELEPHLIRASDFAAFMLSMLTKDDGETIDRLDDGVRHLLACQRNNGGFAPWPQASAGSDFHTTDLACRALSACCDRYGDDGAFRYIDALERARKFLLSTQRQDGSWPASELEGSAQQHRPRSPRAGRHRRALHVAGVAPCRALPDLHPVRGGHLAGAQRRACGLARAHRARRARAALGLGRALERHPARGTAPGHAARQHHLERRGGRPRPRGLGALLRCGRCAVGLGGAAQGPPARRGRQVQARRRRLGLLQGGAARRVAHLLEAHRHAARRPARSPSRSAICCAASPTPSRITWPSRAATRTGCSRCSSTWSSVVLRRATSSSCSTLIEGDDAELSLSRNLTRVMRVYRTLPEAMQRVVGRWVAEMSRGMSLYTHREPGEDGFVALYTTEDLERYCYYVAGTVGHMLTELFEVHMGDTLDKRTGAELRQHAESFGAGLQLVNILKDVTDDRERMWSFVPRAACERVGVGIHNLTDAVHRERAHAAVAPLFDIAREKLDRALTYALTIPPDQKGVRLFCLLPLWMAALTLVHARGNDAMFVAGEEVKISRQVVEQVIADCMMNVSDDAALKARYRTLWKPEAAKERRA